ncbi:MAG: NADH-quinone oxidoreductase subunit C [Candidatus Hydrothermarchaeales archaeon]
MSPEGYLRDQILIDLEKEFPEYIIDTKVKRNRRLVAEIKLEGLMDIMKYLYNEGFDHLSCISGMDYEKNLGLVYHLWSYSKRRTIQINTTVPKDDPRVPSVISIWRTADWHERETYDLMGIIFEWHPNLTRILLPDDWEGHPLRKDVKLKAPGWFIDNKSKKEA